MSTGFPSPEGADPVAQAAAEWVLRHDRGLTAVEQDEFSQWLAADPRHSSAWAEHRWGWEDLDRLAGLQTSLHAVPDPNLLVSQRRVAPHARMAVALAAVVVVAVGALLYFRPVLTEAPPEPTSVNSLALIEQRELPDGSVAVLNRGTIVTEHYSVGTRRVRLERGEAHFKVAKDSARPFLVETGGVTVRAVGTAFNVRLDPASVEVLVTEGKVDVQHRNPAGVHREELLNLSVGERTVVSLASASPPPQVAVVPPAEIEARLAWQPRLLDFTNAPLSEIVAEFNRRNPVRLSLRDPALRGMRLSATFRSDNVEGFVRLLRSDFGVNVEWRGDGDIILSLVHQDGR